MKVLHRPPGAAPVVNSSDSDEQDVPVPAESRMQVTNFQPYQNYQTYQQEPANSCCGQGQYVIVEKKQHICIPGKSVLKVMRRAPPSSSGPQVSLLEADNAPVPQFNMGRALEGAESQAVPYKMGGDPSSGGTAPNGYVQDPDGDLSVEW